MSAAATIPSASVSPSATPGRSDLQLHRRSDYLGPSDVNEFGIPRSESSSRLEADLGPSLSSVLKTFDFSSSHNSFQSSLDFESIRSEGDGDDDEGEESSDSTNLTTNPSTPAFARDKEASASAAHLLGRFESLASPPPPPPPPLLAPFASVANTLPASSGSASVTASTASAAIAASPKGSSIAALGTHFSPEPIGRPQDQIPNNTGYWGTRRLLYPLNLGGDSFAPAVTATIATAATTTPAPPWAPRAAATISIPFRPARSLSPSSDYPGSSAQSTSPIAGPSVSARLPATQDIRTFPNTPPIAVRPLPEADSSAPRARSSHKSSTGTFDASPDTTRNGGNLNIDSSSGSGGGFRDRSGTVTKIAEFIKKPFKADLTSDPDAPAPPQFPRKAKASQQQPSAATGDQRSGPSVTLALDRADPTSLQATSSLSTSSTVAVVGMPALASARRAPARSPNILVNDNVVAVAAATASHNGYGGGRPPHLRSDTVVSSENGSSSGPDSGLHTPASSISAMIAAGQRPHDQLERAESFMSSATSSTYHVGVVAQATIATASSATIRRVEKANMAARPVRLPKSATAASGTRSNGNNGSLARSSSSQTNASSTSGRDETVADFDGSEFAPRATTQRGSGSTVARFGNSSFEKAVSSDGVRGNMLQSSASLLDLDLSSQPTSTFSDTLSAPISQKSSSSSSVGGVEAGARAGRKGSSLASDKKLGKAKTGESALASNGKQHRQQQKASGSLSSIRRPPAILTTATSPVVTYISPRRVPELTSHGESTAAACTGARTAASNGLTVDVGLGIRSNSSSSSPLHSLSPSMSPSVGLPVMRPNLGLALGVDPEFEEPMLSPAPLSSSDSSFRSAQDSGFEAGSSNDHRSQGRTASISTNVSASLLEEPVWGQNRSVATSAPDPALDTLAVFAFPSPIFSSSSNMPMPKPGSAQLRSAATLHSATPSMQSTASTSNGWMPASVSQNSFARLGSGHSRAPTNTTQMSTASRSHAPASSAAGSGYSTVGGLNLNLLGLSRLAPHTREEMLDRLVLDQARVDCQDYGLMSIEDVTNAKRELKALDAKTASLKVKLKVEAKIRDAAVALRKAHRKAPSTSIALPSSPHGGLASPSFDSRGRRASISTSESKADEDATAATAKVDQVTRELLKLNDRAQLLRRMVLEHQVATLAERVDALEADRAMIEEQLPRLASSTSMASSLARSSSMTGGHGNVSSMTIRENRALTSEDIQAGNCRFGDGDKPYQPQGPSYPLSHNRLTSNGSFGSGFSFLDASLPEQVRRLTDELDQTRTNLEQTRRNLAAQGDEIEQSKKQADAFQQEMKGELADSQQKLTESQRELVESQRETQASAAKLQRAIEQVHALQAEKGQSEPELEKLRTQLEQGRRDLAESQEALQLTLQQRLEAERQNHAVELASRLEAAAREVEQRLTKEVEGHEANARAAQQALQAQQATLDQLRGELQESKNAQARHRQVEASDIGAIGDSASATAAAAAAAASGELAKVQAAQLETERLASQRASELDRVTAALAAAEKLAADHISELQKVRTEHAAAERLAAERALECEQARDARATAERLATQRAAELETLSAARAAADKLASDQGRELEQIKAARGTAERQAAENGTKLASEQRAIEAIRAQLDEERRVQAEAEAKIAATLQQAREADSRAGVSDAALRELELAVGAERKIMAERDELFHAFERRLESAERRLQEQDKRCARMLGKLEGREEMDDLLERIKAGAGGVSKKKKTAGQDIADLLTSLETHIEDLADELSRVGGASYASPALRQMEDELDVAEKEAARWRTEAEQATKALEELLRLEEKRSAEAAAAAPRTPSRPPAAAPKEDDNVKELEAKVRKLTSQNGDLERQLRAASTATVSGPSAAAGFSPAGGPGKGVGSLISKFGGGNVNVAPRAGSALGLDVGAAPTLAGRRAFSNSSGAPPATVDRNEIEAELQKQLGELRSRSRKLEETVAELREQLSSEETRTHTSSSSLGLTFNVESMPSFSPRKNAKRLVSVSTSMSPPQARPAPLKPVFSGGLGYNSGGFGGKGALHPPLLSPSRSPIRPFHPPFASTLETRTGGRSPGPLHDVSPAFSNISLPPISPAPSGSPGTTAATGAAVSGGKASPRTITLGMNTSSLILKIRDLERDLVVAQTWQKQSDKIREQEQALRARELQMEEERARDAEMNSRLLEELNESNRMVLELKKRAEVERSMREMEEMNGLLAAQQGAPPVPRK